MAVKEIAVRFEGTVRVNVPDSIPAERQGVLAEKLALALVLATIDNPDAPEDEASTEYQEEFGLSEEQLEHDWDSSKALEVSGTWETTGVG